MSKKAAPQADEPAVEVTNVEDMLFDDEQLCDVLAGVNWVWEVVSHLSDDYQNARADLLRPNAAILSKPAEQRTPAEKRLADEIEVRCLALAVKGWRTIDGSALMLNGEPFEFSEENVIAVLAAPKGQHIRTKVAHAVHTESNFVGIALGKSGIRSGSS